MVGERRTREIDLLLNVGLLGKERAGHLTAAEVKHRADDPMRSNCLETSVIVV